MADRAMKNQKGALMAPFVVLRLATMGLSALQQDENRRDFLCASRQDRV
jgi:hypothetical protein